MVTQKIYLFLAILIVFPTYSMHEEFYLSDEEQNYTGNLWAEEESFENPMELDATDSTLPPAEPQYLNLIGGIDPNVNQTFNDLTVHQTSQEELRNIQPQTQISDLIPAITNNLNLNEKSKAAKKSPLYTCLFVDCGYTTEDKIQFDKHKEIHANKLVFICPVDNCEYKCNDNSCFVEHVIQKHADKRKMFEEILKAVKFIFKCKFDGCQFICNSLYDFVNHIYSNTNHKMAIKEHDLNIKNSEINSSSVEIDMLEKSTSNLTCNFPDCGFKAENSQTFEEHTCKHKGKLFFQCPLSPNCKFACNNLCLFGDHILQNHCQHIREVNAARYKAVILDFKCGFDNCNFVCDTLYDFIDHTIGMGDHTEAAQREYLIRKRRIELIEQNKNKLRTVSSASANLPRLPSYPRVNTQPPTNQPTVQSTFQQTAVNQKYQNQIFSCNFVNCEYQNNVSDNLNKHMLIHQGKLPYTCIVDNCRFACNNLNSFIEHTLKKHCANKQEIIQKGQVNLKAVILNFKCGFNNCTFRCKCLYDLVKHVTTHNKQNSNIDFNFKKPAINPRTESLRANTHNNSNTTKPGNLNIPQVHTNNDQEIIEIVDSPTDQQIIKKPSLSLSDEQYIENLIEEESSDLPQISENQTNNQNLAGSSGMEIDTPQAVINRTPSNISNSVITETQQLARAVRGNNYEPITIAQETQMTSSMLTNLARIRSQIALEATQKSSRAIAESVTKNVSPATGLQSTQFVRNLPPAISQISGWEWLAQQNVMNIPTSLPRSYITGNNQITSNIQQAVPRNQLPVMELQAPQFTSHTTQVSRPEKTPNMNTLVPRTENREWEWSSYEPEINTQQEKENTISTQSSSLAKEKTKKKKSKSLEVSNSNLQPSISEANVIEPVIPNQNQISSQNDIRMQEPEIYIDDYDSSLEIDCQKSNISIDLTNTKKDEILPIQIQSHEISNKPVGDPIVSSNIATTIAVQQLKTQDEIKQEPAQSLHSGTKKIQTDILKKKFKGMLLLLKGGNKNTKAIEGTLTLIKKNLADKASRKQILADNELRLQLVQALVNLEKTFKESANILKLTREIQALIDDEISSQTDNSKDKPIILED